MLATYSFASSAEVCTAIGYQAAGIMPSTSEFRRFTTATAFRPARVTNSRAPSLETAKAVGVAPTGRSGAGLTEMVLSTESERTLITEIVSELEFATYSHRLSGLKTIAEGCSPTATSFTTLADVRSMIETDPVDAIPVDLSTTIWVAELSAVLSPGDGARPPQFVT